MLSRDRITHIPALTAHSRTDEEQEQKGTDSVFPMGYYAPSHVLRSDRITHIPALLADSRTEETAEGQGHHVHGEKPPTTREFTKGFGLLRPCIFQQRIRDIPLW